MIKTEELRIGNLFWDAQKTVQVAYTIHETVVNESWTGPLPDGKYKLNPGYGEDDMEPIPITPEWLKRLGFEKGYKGVYTCDKLDIEPTKDGYQPVTMGHDDYVEYGLSIHYVHELQNLYFALTGEELTIKETV